MIKNFIKSILKPIEKSRFFRYIYWRYLPDETVIIFDFFDKLKIDLGIEVDVGTGSGDTFEPFANIGWTIYGFEPDPLNRKVVMDIYKDKPNVSIDSRAISNKDEKGLPFFQSELSAGISGLSNFDPSHKQNITVDTTTLEIFCKEKSLDKIDYLKIDTEGFDLFVLQGFPWETVKKPTLLMCEFEDTKTIPLGYNFDDVVEFLEKHGYKVIVSEWFPAVKRGGPHKWKDFYTYGSSIPNSASWGNIIAVQGNENFELLNEIAVNVAKRWRIGNVLSELRESILKTFS